MTEREARQYIDDLMAVRAWLASAPLCARKFPEVQELLDKLRGEVVARLAIESKGCA